MAFDESTIVHRDVAVAGGVEVLRVYLVTEDTEAQAEACARTLSPQTADGAECWAYPTKRDYDTSQGCWAHNAFGENGSVSSVTESDPENKADRCPTR